MGQNSVWRDMLAAALLISIWALPVRAQDTLPSEDQCGRIPTAETPVLGWCIAIQKHKGNCLACHRIGIENRPEGFIRGGNLGPELTSIRERFPDKAKLRAQIWDPSMGNPQSVMPPYGRHRILSEAEIDLLVEFLLTI
ncbi:MAG: sulfur oxidation c-type cytochrome SoxX [Gammaproteobacteria bacterium]|nr:sulfur oxidation c-type cytochrome SoxX [Gammaproteobacteria bacterium]